MSEDPQVALDSFLCQTSCSAPKKLARRYVAFFWIAAFVFLYLELFIPPAAPILFGGDQTIYMLNATRILQGQVMYKDFFQFTPPATELVYVMLFKLFGVRAWISQAMLVLIGVSLAWLSTSISAKLVRAPAIILPALLFLTMVFTFTLDATHHWYSAVAVMCALGVTIERRSPARLAAASVLCGLATCFTQLQGLAALLAIGVFLIWEGRRKAETAASLAKREAWLVMPFFCTVAALNAYFVWKAGIERFYYCTIIFGLKYYPAEWFNTWRVYMSDLPTLGSWLSLPSWGAFFFIHGILPLVYLLFFTRYWRVSRSQPEQPWERLMLVNSVGLFLFLGMAPAPGYLRLCSVSLPALITLVWFATQSGRFEKFLLGSLWMAALAFAPVGPARRQLHRRAFLDLPTGRTAFLDPVKYEECRWLSERTRPSDAFFGDMDISLALGLRNPAQINFVTSTDYTRPEQVANLIQVMERERIRYTDQWDFTMGDPTVDPRANISPGVHLVPFVAYLRSHYHIAKTFTNLGVVLERNQ